MDDFQKLLLETFGEEARETVQALEKALLELEQAEDSEERQGPYSTLARRAHNLKGAAGAAGVSSVQSLSHALEDALTGLRDLGEEPKPAVFDVLYLAIDTIRDLAADSSTEPATELEKQLESLLEVQTQSDDATPPDTAPIASQAEPTEPEPEPDEAPTSDAPVEPGPALGAQTRAGVGPGVPPEPATSQPAGTSTPTPTDVASQDISDVAPPDRSEEVSPDTERVPEEDADDEESASPAPEKQKGVPRRREPEDETPQRRTVRIAVDKLDALMNQIGEIITVRKKSQARLSEVQEMADTVSATVRDFHAAAKSIRRHLERVESEITSETIDETLSSFSAGLERLESEFIEFHRQSLQEASTESLLTERLPEDIKRLRMRPFGTLEELLRRTARDAARHSSKEIELELTGMDSEADQVVLDVIRDPLMHLLRNCIDHGIERPQTRVAHGKPRKGRVFVDVEARGATLYINVGDDGAGIDPIALRERVRETNQVPSTQLDAMSRRELIDLIFLPGLSTADELGMISGRGIGMDVVREVAQQYHGSVSVETEEGRGTTFELTMPLTFATVQGIIVRVLGHDLALPMYALDRLVRLSRKDITYIEGSPTVSIEDQPVSLIPMSEIIEVPPDFERSDDTPEWEEDAYSEAMLYGAVVRSGDRRVAFMVDDFVGESEMVVKEIPDFLGRIPNVSGATITWSGEVMVILNPADLVNSAVQKVSPGVEKEWAMDALPSRRVLVCDDSVTTRTLEKNILAAAGYDVVTATNGIEALRIAEEQSFQLIVLDVDMPEMTGFELASRLRMTPAYRDVPIILVTSRDTEEDKRRGLAAGADAYITKQSFTQRTFLETVRRFLA